MPELSTTQIIIAPDAVPEAVRSWLAEVASQALLASLELLDDGTLVITGLPEVDRTSGGARITHHGPARRCIAQAFLMEENALTLADVLLIHELLILSFGGMRGVTEHGFGKLDAAVAAPYASMFGQDLYPDVPVKAATLFWGIARSHGFSDGNKRVALVAVLDFLDRYQHRLTVDEEGLYTFVITAAHDLTREQVSAWFEEHVQPVE